MGSLLEAILCRQRTSMSAYRRGRARGGRPAVTGKPTGYRPGLYSGTGAERLACHAQRQPAEAERWLQKPVRWKTTPATLIPPEVVKPSYELAGEWLLEQDRPEDALRQFERALERPCASGLEG